MDVTQALKDAENALRDFITYILIPKHGEEWYNHCGVSPERVKKWSERKVEDSKRIGITDERIIYYADFYDIKTILKNNWDKDFSSVFGEWRKMDVWLSTLESFRNPDSHRRELLLHQKYLILGICSEIRLLIIRYRSMMETSEDYYPRIESIQDRLGNTWTPSITGLKGLFTKNKLRPGDVINFIVTATDPLGESVEIAVMKPRQIFENWTKNNHFEVIIDESDVMKSFGILIRIRSLRKYHAESSGIDDSVGFFYEVLPPKNSKS